MVTGTSPLQAIVDLLRNDPVVVNAVGTVMVYGQRVAAVCGEIDGEWSRHMPRRVVLVREAGERPRTGVGPLSWPRFDVRCYGADPGGAADASELSHQIDGRLFGKVNRATGVVAVSLNAGPQSGRESRTGWAYVDRTYDMLAG